MTVHGLTKVTKHLKHKVKLNEPDLDSDNITDIDLLVGMDQYFKIVQGQKQVDGINLTETVGRFVIAGPLSHR